ncbi:twin-arginine translocase TatA/TatE family subunit [uncultured Marinobacter sp.]|uniref:Sec-independent protein translocase subunit TatA/TatB n=1 Tax=uncultured Marinobacter sp. TaxID=187379 RepID=UPI0030D89C08
MFDFGWMELAFLAMLALIIVGPKDLPRLANAVGKLWGRARRLYRDALGQLQKLENEMDLASRPDERLKPSYYDLLPEHVRQAMEMAEPSRDAEHNRKVDAMFREALAELHQPAPDTGTKHSEPEQPETGAQRHDQPR